MAVTTSARQPAQGVAISAERLLDDFGGHSPSTREGVRAFYQVLQSAEGAAAGAALALGQTLLGTDRGQQRRRQAAGLDRLAAHYGIAAEGMRPEALLVALQTWYVLVVQLLVGRVVGHVRRLASPAERLHRAAGKDSLGEELAALASGESLRELQVEDLFRGTPPIWDAAVGSEPTERAIRELATRLSEYDPSSLPGGGAGGRDFLKPLYQGLFPGPLRHALGEFYTPDWLTDHVLDQVGYRGDAPARLLDPACGSGTFLVAAIGRLRAHAPREPGPMLRTILDNVVGLDLHPLAVLTARANYVMAVADLLPQAGPIDVPVVACDAILDGPGPRLVADGFDYVVGNPPWIAWDNLPDDYRRATKPWWERYGLFSLSGREARHGGAKKDLAMLMLYAAADRYLRRGGRLGMVVTQTLFQTKGAGDGFRRFRLGPDGDWLGVLRVDDLVAVRPFGDAANRTSTIVLEKGRPTEYPVRYVKWTPEGTDRRTPEVCWARPIEPHRPGSPWFLAPEGWTGDMARLVGPSDYTAHLGANSGGANGIYWLDVLGRDASGVRVRNRVRQGRGEVPAIEAVVEPDLLYPLVRWSDVDRYLARPSAYLLLTQDLVSRSGLRDDLMEARYPRTFAYLKRFEAILARRAAYRRYQEQKPFYSMYNVGTYTIAPIKVVWRRMDRKIRAAVLEAIDDPHLGRRPAVPQETCVLVACQAADEAHYLCAVLNSAAAGFLVAGHSIAGAKGFGTPGILDFLPIRRYDVADRRHLALAACSRQAQAIRSGVPPGETSADAAAALEDLQRRIDQLAEGL